LRHSRHTRLRHAGKWEWPIFWNIVRRHYRWWGEQGRWSSGQIARQT